MVGVAHDETDGAAGRFALEHTAEQLHLIGFVTRCGQGALPRPAAVQFRLDEIQVDVYAGGHTVYHTSDGGSMALAKGGQCEMMAERVHLDGVLRDGISESLYRKEMKKTEIITSKNSEIITSQLF